MWQHDLIDVTSSARLGIESRTDACVLVSVGDLLRPSYGQRLRQLVMTSTVTYKAIEIADGFVEAALHGIISAELHVHLHGRHPVHRKTLRTTHD